MLEGSLRNHVDYVDVRACGLFYDDAIFTIDHTKLNYLVLKSLVFLNLVQLLNEVSDLGCLWFRELYFEVNNRNATASELFDPLKQNFHLFPLSRNKAPRPCSRREVKEGGQMGLLLKRRAECECLIARKGFPGRFIRYGIVWYDF